MRQIILNVLKEIACKNTGSCQINLQSESAQIMIADKLVEQLDSFNRQLIEDIVCGVESEVK